MHPFTYGALCTFGAHFSTFGKHEVWDVYQSGVEKRTSLTTDPKVERLGRTLAYLIEPVSTAFAGGYMIATLVAGIDAGEPTGRIAGTYSSGGLNWYSGRCVLVIGRMGGRLGLLRCV